MSVRLRPGFFAKATAFFASLFVLLGLTYFTQDDLFSYILGAVMVGGGVAAI